MKILGGTYRSTFFGSEVLTHEEGNGLAIMIYNKKRYGIISGPNLTVFTETGEELVYERNSEPGSWKTAPLTAGQYDYSRNAIALLHLAEHLLKTGQYTTAQQAR
jgi:hypothetical protein